MAPRIDYQDRGTSGGMPGHIGYKPILKPNQGESMERLHKPIQDLFYLALHEIHEAVVSTLPLTPTHDGANFEWTISGNVCDYDSLVESELRFVALSQEHDRVRTDVTGSVIGTLVRPELIEKINARLQPFDLEVRNSDVDQVTGSDAYGPKNARVSIHIRRSSWATPPV